MNFSGYWNSRIFVSIYRQNKWGFSYLVVRVMVKFLSSRVWLDVRTLKGWLMIDLLSLSSFQVCNLQNSSSYYLKNIDCCIHTWKFYFNSWHDMCTSNKNLQTWERTDSDKAFIVFFRIFGELFITSDEHSFVMQ